jgi:hypothetical protein
VTATAARRPRAPQAIEEEIRRRRVELGAIAAELDRRRRDLTNPRLLVRRHAVGVTVTVLAVGAAAAGSIAYRSWRARRERTLPARGGRLRDALRRMIDRPERVAVEPTATQRIIGSAGSAAAAFLIRAALERLSRPHQEARPGGWFARPSR